MESPDGAPGSDGLETGNPTVATALAAVRRHPAWAVLRLRDEPIVRFVGGPVSHVERLGSAARCRPLLPAACRSSVRLYHT